MIYSGELYSQVEAVQQMCPWFYLVQHIFILFPLSPRPESWLRQDKEASLSQGYYMKNPTEDVQILKPVQGLRITKGPPTHEACLFQNLKGFHKSVTFKI